MLEYWISGLAVYVALLVTMIWIWSRCTCELRSQYEPDEDTTEKLLRSLAMAERPRPARVTGRPARRRRVRSAA